MHPFITVLAVIAGADDFDEITLYAREKQSWSKSFLKLPGGIPSHDTFTSTPVDQPTGFPVQKAKVNIYYAFAVLIIGLSVPKARRTHMERIKLITISLFAMLFPRRHLREEFQ